MTANRTHEDQPASGEDEGLEIDPIDFLTVGSPSSERVRIVNLTRKFAEALVKVIPDHQRGRSNARMIAWAKDMTEGRWQLNNDAFVVVRHPVTGVIESLENGQHRVLARLRVPEEMDVDLQVPVMVMEVPKENIDRYLAMDTGRSRSFGDFLKAKGYKDYYHLAATTRACLMADSNKGVYPVGKDDPRTHPQLWEYLQSCDADLMDIAIKTGSRVKGRTGASPRNTSAIVYLAGRDWDLDAVVRFYELARLGKDPDPDMGGEHPSVLLYRRMMEWKIAKTKQVPVVAQWMTQVKALHFYASGQRPQRLSWQPTRERPIPVCTDWMLQQGRELRAEQES